MCEASVYLLDNIYIRFGTKLYRQIVGIPMGTSCAPLVADLFLFCYERDFMTSLSDVKQAEIIEAFKSTSRYLDNLLNIDNPCFEDMVNRIYPPELQLNKANTSDTEAPFLDLYLSISKGFVSSKIYDKRDDFDFDMVNFPFLDGDVPRSTFYWVCHLFDHLFGKELFILFAASALRKLSSIYVFSYFPFGFEGRIWDLIVSVPDHCLSFYFTFLNLFGLLECIVKWLISMPVIKV